VTARVAAVVLSWNDRELTLRCLDSLAAVTYPALRVILVDSGSSDDTVESVRRLHPGVELVELPVNRGFAGGVNAGIEAALAGDAEHVFLLNNDATVEPEVVQPLVGALDDSVGAACSQILHEGSGTIWYAGASYDPRRGHQGRHTGYGRPALPPTTESYATDRGCGGAMLMPRAALERVGGFDESLFAYAEDVDWSLRARSAGLEIRVVPASVVHHRVSAASGGASSPATLYYALRNGLVVAERYAPLGSGRTLVRRAEAFAAFVVQALRSGSRLAGLRAVVQGARDASRRRLGPWTG
jgi:GT2 family glycosyltransferase